MGQINRVDVDVGQRLRIARLAKGMSQSAIAEAAGVSFQQIQKYEQGKNRISAGRLAELAGVLGVGIGYFFEEPGPPGVTPTNLLDLDLTKLDLSILRQVSEIRDPRLKRKVLELIGLLAETAKGTPVDRSSTDDSVC